jgi:uncharacterized membrane protein YbaN (DUF454 family)
MPAESERKMFLQFFYVVYDIHGSFIETIQIIGIFIAKSIMTYLLLQYFCMARDGCTVNTELFHDLWLTQSIYVTNYKQIWRKSPIKITLILFSAD